MLLVVIPVLAVAAESPLHPLDPLSSGEILKTAEVLRGAGRVTDQSRFSLIALHEPPKEEVLSFRPGAPMRREAFAVVYERESNKTFEAVVDLRAGAVVSWNHIPGVQPSVLDEDIEILERAIRADPRFAQAMRRRGITDFSRVGIGDWAGGYFGEPGGYRFRRAEFFYKDSTNSSDRVIENVTAEVNLNTGKVIGFTDGEVVPIPASGSGIDAISIAAPREALKPLVITQPYGPSFEVRGHEVRWQHWNFRFGVNAREGLVLYTVAYEDAGRMRSVMYRGSCSEMVVPYGDPSFGWFFRNAFDAGEDSFGRLAAPLESLTDYPANAMTFDAVMPSERGDWFLIPRAVALYERDGGLSWKHHDRGRNRNESRRARELVLTWVATVGNYDYGFNWVFHQDGTLEMETLLTGFMETKAVNMTKVPDGPHDHEKGELKYGHLVAPNVLAVHHQHFFSFRLDMDVDGTNNSVLEMNTEPLPPGPANPYQNAFTMKETVFHNEQEAVRQMSLAASRRWTVFNPSVRNSLGYAAGYTLLPGENAVPYAAPDSWVRKRAGFINAPFWVTRNDPAQIFAAGLYVNQSKGDDGLHRWVEAKRPIENQDVVLWYTMGITHLPRVEEHPIMTVHKASFKLVPNGFFEHNPAIDLPR